MKVITVAEFLKWLESLNAKQREAVDGEIDRLRKSGHLLKMPHTKHMEGPFFELRVTAEKVEIRVFYALKGDAWVLTGGQKSGRKSEKFYETQLKRAKRLWTIYEPKKKKPKQEKGGRSGRKR